MIDSILKRIGGKVTPMTPPAPPLPTRRPQKRQRVDRWGMMQSGIYAIVSTESRKAYIGSTVSFRKRWNAHKSNLCKGAHKNPHLQAAWDKYGASAFEFEVCEYVEDREQLHAREQYWLDFHRMLTEVYNHGPSARNPNLGTHLSEETRRKISEAMKGNQYGLGYKHTKEARCKISEAARGYIATAESRRKLSEASKGHTTTTETRRKIGAANGRAYTAFVHRITGEVIPAGGNLTAVCREHGLGIGNMCNVKNGVRPHHRGWILLSEHVQLPLVLGQ